MRPSDYAPKDTPAVSLAVADAAHEDIGQCEEPPGSNRGPFPDACNRASGSPLGSPYCGGAAAKWADAAGAKRPPHDAGSCDEWVRWAKQDGLWREADPWYVPPVGSFVLYTNRKRLTAGRYAGQLDAVHIEVVGRTAPLWLSIGANTTFGNAPVALQREGLGVAEKMIDRTRVYGYVLAVAREGA